MKKRQMIRRLSGAAAVYLLAAVPCALIGGCRSDSLTDAKTIVSEGSTACADLQHYYTTLSQEEANRNSLVKFQRAVGLGGSLPDEPGFESQLIGQGVSLEDVRKAEADYKRDEEQSASVVAALNARADMAAAMKNTYDALGKLTNYDASGELSKSAAHLSQTIQDVDNRPLTLPTDNFVPEKLQAKSLLDGLVRLIAHQQQERDVRKTEPLVRQMAASATALYKAESSDYQSIAHGYYEETFVSIQPYIKRDPPGRGLTISQSAIDQSMQDSLELYGLKGLVPPRPSGVSDPTLSANDAAAYNYWRKQMDKKKQAYYDSVPQENKVLLRQLCTLVVDHARFEQNKKLTGASDADQQEVERCMAGGISTPKPNP